MKHLVNCRIQEKKIRFIYVEKKNQLDASERFIVLIIRVGSTCFEHFYAHHQELETICVTTACGVQCLVAGCRGSGAEQQALCPGRAMSHDSVVQHLHSLFLVRDFLAKHATTVLPQPPYSPDLAPATSFCFQSSNQS